MDEKGTKDWGGGARREGRTVKLNIKGQQCGGDTEKEERQEEAKAHARFGFQTSVDVKKADKHTEAETQEKSKKGGGAKKEQN